MTEVIRYGIGCCIRIDRASCNVTARSGQSTRAVRSNCSNRSARFRIPDPSRFYPNQRRDLFRPFSNGGKWKPFGNWNDRCAQAMRSFQFRPIRPDRDHRFREPQDQSRVISIRAAAEGVVATSEEEMDRITEFVEQVRTRQPEFNYQRNTIYLRFCHADYHKGAALAELSRLIKFRAKRFSRRAIITMTFQCSTGVSPRCRRAPPVRSTR